MSVVGAVLAHGGKAQTVLEAEIADLQRLEEFRNGLAAGLRVSGSTSRWALGGSVEGHARGGLDVNVGPVGHFGEDLWNILNTAKKDSGMS